MIGNWLITYFFHAIERLLIRRWCFDADGPTNYESNKKKAKIVQDNVPERVKNTSIWDKAVFAIDLLFSPRSIGKPWQINKVANYDDKNPTFVPSRRRFLVQIALQSICLFLIADFARMAPPPNPGLFGPRKIPLLTRLSQVTAEELIIRIFATVAFWVNTYIVACLIANVPSLMSVGSGLSSPASWRPTYGSLSEAYTIRKFWGWAESSRSHLFKSGTSLLMQHFLAPEHSRHLRRHIKLHKPWPAAHAERFAGSSLLSRLYHLHHFGAHSSRNRFWVRRSSPRVRVAAILLHVGYRDNVWGRHWGDLVSFRGTHQTRTADAALASMCGLLMDFHFHVLVDA